MNNCFSEKVVKTRKPHKCWGCAEVIPVGTKVKVSTCADNGSVFDCHWCKTCEDFMQTLSSQDLADGFPFGELKYFDKYPLIATEKEGK